MREPFLNWISTIYAPEPFIRLWGTTVFICFLFHIAERLRPAERNQPHRAMLSNAWIMLVYAILSPIARAGGNYLACSFLTSLMYQLTGEWSLIDLKALTSASSSIAQIALLALLALAPFVAYDTFYYWFHRLQHSNSWLWEQHKLHHSDQSLNVTTSSRINWLEDFFKSVLVSLPMAVVLGLEPSQAGILAALGGTLSHFWGVYLHSNIRLSYGRLSPLLSGPQFHRIHHSIEKHHQNRNFSTYFPIFDILFGTYHRPELDEYPKTGIVGEVGNPSLRVVLFGPLLNWAQRLAAIMPRLARTSMTKEQRRVVRPGAMSAACPDYSKANMAGHTP